MGFGNFNRRNATANERWRPLDFLPKVFASYAEAPSSAIEKEAEILDATISEAPIPQAESLWLTSKEQPRPDP